MKTFLKQLISDKSDESKIDHIRLWSNIAYAVSTWAFIYVTIKDQFSVELMLVYLGVVGSSYAAGKFLAFKYKRTDGEQK